MFREENKGGQPLGMSHTAFVVHTTDSSFSSHKAHEYFRRRVAQTLHDCLKSLWGTHSCILCSKEIHATPLHLISSPIYMYIMDTEHDVRGENAWTRENKYPSRDNLSRILKIVQ